MAKITILVMALAGCSCSPGIIPLQHEDSEQILRLDGAILTINCQEK